MSIYRRGMTNSERSHLRLLSGSLNDASDDTFISKYNVDFL